MRDHLHDELRHQMLARRELWEDDSAYAYGQAIWEQIADDLAQEREQRERERFEETFITTPLADEMNPAGWPRPVLVATVSRAKSAGGTTDRWPTPWISQLAHTDAGPKTVLKEFNQTRRQRAQAEGLCQVCGQQCFQMAYAPVLAADLDAEIFISGSPVCSVRCAKLAIAFCPHFDTDPALVCFALADVSWSGITFEFSVSTYEVVDLA